LPARAKSLKVATTTWFTWNAQNWFAGGPIDNEFEFKVLQGATRTISRHKPVLI
jgi:hypothetical protein